MLLRQSVLDTMNGPDLERQGAQCWLKAGDALANWIETGDAECYNAFLWYDQATRQTYDILSQRKYQKTGENYCHLVGSMPGQE